MVSASIVFWTWVLMFGFVGLMRAWQKEVIATASLVLAIFVLNFANQGNRLVDFVKDAPPTDPAKIAQERESVQISKWGVQAVPFLVIAFFGYLGPALTRSVASGKFPDKARVGVQEGIVGFMLGGLNGYIIFSTLVYFAFRQGMLLDTGNFPSTGSPIFTPLPGGFPWSKLFFIENSAYLILSGPTLIIALVVLFLFVIIAFI